MIVKILKNAVPSLCEEAVGTRVARYLWNILDLCFLHSPLLGFFFDESRTTEIFEVFHLVLLQENDASSNRTSVVDLIEKYIQNKEITSYQVCDSFEYFAFEGTIHQSSKICHDRKQLYILNNLLLYCTL